VGILKMKATKSKVVAVASGVFVNSSLVDAAKAAAKKGLEISEGTHDISFVLEVDATVTKGAGFEQVVAQAVCPYTLLAEALNRLNAATANSVIDLVRDVAEMSEASRKELREQMKQRTKAAMAELGSSATKMVSGKTTFANVVATIRAKDSELSHQPVVSLRAAS
jgi:hypothetical protein